MVGDLLKNVIRRRVRNDYYFTVVYTECTVFKQRDIFYNSSFKYRFNSLKIKLFLIKKNSLELSVIVFNGSQSFLVELLIKTTTTKKKTQQYVE